jgi:23S rRNA (cytosine1962-C5)-methyltransferase
MVVLFLFLSHLFLSMAKPLTLSIKATSPKKFYEYIDSGNLFRLERFGDILVSRSCPTAKWPKTAALSSRWAQAQLKYIGQSGKRGTWQGKLDAVQSNWTVSFDRIGSFRLQLSEYGQVGVFPEQESNWHWIQNVLEEETRRRSRIINVLNGFAYTGGSTMASLSAGPNIRVSFDSCQNVCS